MHTASIAGPLLVLGELCTGFQLVPGIPAPNKFDAEVVGDGWGVCCILEVATVDCDEVDASEDSRGDVDAVVVRA